MPIQAPQWTDYLNCPVCCREFGPPPRCPISLGCGHTLCSHCLKRLHKKQCPFDQTVIQSEPEDLVVNTALLQLAGYAPPAQPHHPPCIQVLPEHDKLAYDAIVRDLEHLAVYLKLCGSANSGLSGNRLSRPMQKKLVTLLLCSISDEEGRGRAARAARSLGERTVTELILQHQNPQQLSANLWAAVRARGCQFLGPAMQEEVLKLVLLALEDGSALSRKVLVMFVVQRLEPHFPQASKTSIGHVVQLLYRASCFKVSKRESDSSLMQLKDEFRTYGSLRREHDAQIVQIASEAGLRIAPDQWSSLLYGDTAHKSHMQSIIDKLQTPQSFAQSVQDLFIALQRSGDPAQLLLMSIHLDRLANIDISQEQKSPTLQELAELINSTKEVVSGLIHYLQKAISCDSNHNKNSPLENCEEQSSKSSATPLQDNKMPMCRISAIRAFCPNSDQCPFLHFDEEFERIKAKELEESNEYAVVLPEYFALILQRPIINQRMMNGEEYGYAAEEASSDIPLVNRHQLLYMAPRPTGSIGSAVAQRLFAMSAVTSMAVPRFALPVPVPPQHIFPHYPLPPRPQLPQLRLSPVEGYMQNVPTNGQGVANMHDTVYGDNIQNEGLPRPNFGHLVVGGPMGMAVLAPFYPGGVVPTNMGICYPRPQYIRPIYNVTQNIAVQNHQNIAPLPSLPANNYAQYVSHTQHAQYAPYQPHAQYAPQPQAPYTSFAPHSPQVPYASLAPLSPQGLYASLAPLSPQAAYASREPLSPQGPYASRARQSPYASRAPQSPYASRTPPSPYASRALQSPYASLAQHSPQTRYESRAPLSPQASYGLLAQHSPQTRYESRTPLSPQASYGLLAQHSPQTRYESRAPQSPQVPYMPQAVYAARASQSPHAPFTPQVPFNPQAPYTPQAPFTQQEPFTPQAPLTPQVPFTQQAPFTPQAPFKPQALYSSRASHSPQAPLMPQALYASRAAHSPQAPYTPRAPFTPQAVYAPQAQYASREPTSPRAVYTPQAQYASLGPSSPQAVYAPQAQYASRAPRSPQAVYAPQAQYASRAPRSPRAVRASQAPFASHMQHTLDSSRTSRSQHASNASYASLSSRSSHVPRALYSQRAALEQQAQLDLPDYIAFAFNDAQVVQHPGPVEYQVTYQYGNEQPENHSELLIYNEHPSAAAAELRAEVFANRANEMFSDPPARLSMGVRTDDFINRANHV